VCVCVCVCVSVSVSGEADGKVTSWFSEQRAARKNVPDTHQNQKPATPSSIDPSPTPSPPTATAASMLYTLWRPTSDEMICSLRPPGTLTITWGGWGWGVEGGGVEGVIEGVVALNGMRV